MQKTTATALLWLAFGLLLAFGSLLAFDSRATGLVEALNAKLEALEVGIRLPMPRYEAVIHNSGSMKHKQYTMKNTEASPSEYKIATKVTSTM